MTRDYTIEIATSIRSGQPRYKHLRNHAEKIRVMIDAMMKANKALGLLRYPKGLTIKIRPISNGKRSKLFGRYSLKKNTIELEVKRYSSYIAKTFAHELIHADQVERGDLALSSTLRQFVWKGSAYSNTSSYGKKYRGMPHEVEAFALMDEYANKLLVRAGVLEQFENYDNHIRKMGIG